MHRTSQAEGAFSLHNGDIGRFINGARSRIQWHSVVTTRWVIERVTSTPALLHTL